MARKLLILASREPIPDRLLGNVSANATTPDMRIPMGCYIAGLVLCACAYATTYISQFFRFNELVNDAYANRQGVHTKWLRLAFSLAILSIVSFGVKPILS